LFVDQLTGRSWEVHLVSLTENPRAPLDVLIAEDDTDLRVAVRQLLECQGYSCAEAEDGRVAVQVARERPPRLVLLDLMMPEVDGFATAQQLRSDPRTRGVRIHCLTALDFPAARRAAEEAGCDGFLAKPFTPDELLEVVKAALYALRPGDDGLGQALEQLAHALNARVPGREHPWSTQLAAALTDLESILQPQAAQLAAAGGLLAEADLSRPTLVRRAAELRQERHHLLTQSRALRAQVRDAAQAFRPAGDRAGTVDALPEPAAVGRAVDFSEIRRSAEQLATSLKRHAEAERDLLFESLNTDIGVGD
jgi:two-component system cell cycle response regulator DivK